MGVFDSIDSIEVGAAKIDFVIYGKSMCPNCEKAKQFLERWNFDYKYVNLEDDLQKFLELKNKGIRQVPVIEVDNEIIGSYNELLVWFDRNMCA